jgi:hypothetical protein
MADTIEAINPVTATSSVQDVPAIAAVARVASPTDTVTLSNTAQATLLQEHGQTVGEIASALGISTSEVLNDLGLTASVAATATTAPAPLTNG